MWDLIVANAIVYLRKCSVKYLPDDDPVMLNTVLWKLPKRSCVNGFYLLTNYVRTQQDVLTGKKSVSLLSLSLLNVLMFILKWFFS